MLTCAQARGNEYVRILSCTGLVGVVLSLTGQGVTHGEENHCPAPEFAAAKVAPPAPKAEPVKITELPLPPAAPTDAPGACAAAINPHRTGCILASDQGIIEGPSYMPDGVHVLLPIAFAGAPSAPDPASIYQGYQVIAIKTNGALFPNGDAWKCITCGVPVENRKGANSTQEAGAGYIGKSQTGNRPGPNKPINLLVDHPQAFPDGRRMIAGTNVVECGVGRLTDETCTPERVHIYPMRWGRTADGSGESFNMRELRLHPDGVHLGWSTFAISAAGLDEFAGYGKLVFNPAPTGGVPLTPRYDVENVTLLVNTTPEFQVFRVDPAHPGELIHNKPMGYIGEFRGWSSDGKYALGLHVEESGNFDLYLTSMASGESIRITRDPGYTDPVKMSPDDQWSVMMDTRPYDRHLWYSAMGGIPPLTDMLTMAVPAYAWRDGNRRFFQPILLDRYAERGSYHGQQLNAGPDIQDSPSDRNWNGRADPAWSPDGTRIVYWQALVTAPACGKGHVVAECPVSTEQGGRRARLMMAQLTSRKPVAAKRVPPAPDFVSWGIVYRSGDKLPVRPPTPVGKFVLKGRVGGSAQVEIRRAANSRGVGYVSAKYSGFSDDGIKILNGTESVESAGGVMSPFIWHSHLTLSGCHTGAKTTSEPEGFKVEGDMIRPMHWSGTLSTTVDGKTWTSPSNP